MKTHLIEVGPTAIRRLCCGGATVADTAVEGAAFDCIDDPVALVDLRPVTVASLWHQALASVDCGSAERVTVVHPSWWSSSRVDVIGAAAQALVGDVETRPRSWLLAAASRASVAVILEITDDFVVATGEVVVVESRNRDVEAVADAVVDSVTTAGWHVIGTVVIDAPASVSGAGALASAIVKALSRAGAMEVLVVDEVRLRRTAAQLDSSDPSLSVPARRTSAGSAGRVLAVVAVAGALFAAGALQRHTTPRADDRFPTTSVVEGHVVLEVPAQWSTRRIVAGPGSARVQITSPIDPEIALHVTQSRVALPGLDATADFLKSAIDAAPVDVFVDFNPRDQAAGHPVVTYREIRGGHDIRWTVWVEKFVRISIGCQNPTGRRDAVNRECDLAIRSARALL